jgi:hypothetical protein
LSLAYPASVNSLKSVAFGDGMPASAKWIREGILAQYTKAAAKAAKPAKKAVAKKLPVKKAAPKKTAAKKTKAAKSGKKGAK